jgi:hypothetical protein
MKKSKITTFLICLFLGVIGIHFIYLGRYKEARIRFFWFLLCNPVAFYKTFKDGKNILRMNEYQFYTKYCQETVKETGTYKGLHTHLSKLEQKK